MTNTEQLKNWGFIEINGFLCSPNLANKPIFKVEEVNNHEMSLIIKQIIDISFHMGSVVREHEIKQQVVKNIKE